jgi:pyruvate dehydrogenase E2 component (dihydrolipoamide acetyltransferase)
LPTPVTMPMLGLTMEEGTVAAWLKQEGDRVEKDEPLLTVEMDKGTQDVPSPASGRVGRILVPTGQTVPVKTPLVEILTEAEAAPPPAPASPPDTGGVPTAGQVASATVDAAQAQAGAAAVAPEGAGSATATSAAPGRPGVQEPPPPGAPSAAPDTGGVPTPGQVAAATVEPAGLPVGTILTPGQAAGAAEGGRRFVSPRARLRARELGVDLLQVRGTGPQARVVEADVLAAAQARAQPQAPAAVEPQRQAVTPVARRLAQEHGVALEELQGTGPGGRVTQEDVLRAAAQRAPTAAPSGVPTPTPATAPAGDGQVVPLSRVRRITAERMAASSQAVARVTLFLEADLSEAARFRRQLAPEFERLGTPKLPWDALFAKAAGLALAEHPQVNAQWVEGQGLRRTPDVSVGVAVALDPEGLVVPVLRQADRRSLRELAGDLLALVEKARANRLAPADMQGGGFTITNLGQYRVDGFTPIVNPPEAAILGVGRIADKPVVVDGKVEARTSCTLSLSFDHRVVDGAPAAAFLARLAELLERPYTLLGI